MNCKESYAEFVSDRRASESEANELNVKCRWHPGGMPGLEMRSAFDADRQMKNLPLKSAAPPDAVPSPPRPQGK